MARLAPFLFVLSVAAASAQPPNIVLIISDDAGFADFGFMDSYTQTVNPGQAGSPVPTPRLDELRARGVLFTDAYTAAVCSPSRAALLTGSYQQRIGYEFNINNLTDPNGTFEGLRAEDVTIFERMKALGYSTGAIGKWHVGGIPDIVAGGSLATPGNRPPRQGVDEFFGILRGSRNYAVGGLVGDVTRAVREMSLGGDGLEVNIEREAEHAGEYVTNTFGQGAVDFIDRHYDDAAPFFLYVSFTAPHSPIGPSPDRGAPGVSSNYGSMVYTMDKEIGRIMDKVANPAGDGSVDLTPDTLFIFINDNGGASGIGTRNTPLRGWKGSTYEGGIRVPMVFAGAGVTAAPGSVFAEPVHSVDLVATCHELGGGAPLAEIDGVNLLPFVSGAAGGSPHGAIVVRNRGEYGVREGDWKLSRQGGAAELYDLGSNIGEDGARDLASENPEVVQRLQRILTEHEVRWDKPRFHGLGQGADTINRNDRFIFAPTPPSGETFVPNLPLVGAGLRNGDFEDPVFTADQRPFSDVAGWTNTGTGGPAQVLGRTNLNRTSPQNAVLPDSASRVAALDTGHTVAAGEVFAFSYWWRDASNWSDDADRIGLRLFTTADDTLTGTVSTVREYLSPTSNTNSTYEYVEGSHTATPDEDGKRLFLAVRGVDGNGNPNGFARLDDVTLARGVFTSGGDGLANARWSDGGAWTDADTGQSDTLLETDSFPGAVLEFPAAEGFSYSAENDMVRATGLPFMLNRIELTGEGGKGGSATLTGNAIMTCDRVGLPPAGIKHHATGNFEFVIDTPIIAWDAVVVDGDGTAPLTIAGEISDPQPGHPGLLIKRGSCPLTLAGDQPFTGRLGVEAGTLTMDDVNLPGANFVPVSEGATITGMASLGGSFRIAGTLAIDLDAGHRFDVSGGVDIAGGTLALSGTPADGQVILTYGSLTGSFASVTGMLPGFELDSSEPRVIRIASVAGDPFDAWVAASGFTGDEAHFDADPNGDGVPNGVAFFLGAPSASTDATTYLPTVEYNPAGASLRFWRSELAGDLEFEVTYSTDLEEWSIATDGQDGIEIAILGAGIDSVVVDFPPSLAPDAQFYCQLLVRKP